MYDVISVRPFFIKGIIKGFWGFGVWKNQGVLSRVFKKPLISGVFSGVSGSGRRPKILGISPLWFPLKNMYFKGKTMFIDSKISKFSPAAGCIENTHQFIANNTHFDENSCRTTFLDFFFQGFYQGFLSGVLSRVFTPEPRIRKKGLFLGARDRSKWAGGSRELFSR